MLSSPRSLLRRLARTSPVVVGSIVLHAGLAMALVANGGGHARASVSLPVASLDVDVAPVEAPTLEPVPEPPAAEKPEHDHDDHVPMHTHTYPVAPSHDAHPHDPALRHDGTPLTPVADEPAHEAAPALAAAVAEAPPSALPTFTIPSGAGRLATSGAVSAVGSGSGAPVAAGAGTGGSADDAVVPAAGVHVAARLVSSVVAAYPAAARSDDVEGDVGVEIVVDREGRVIEARVARPAGHGFDDAALTAIRRYRFSPAQRDGHAVRVRMPWSVQFRLR
jgi:TonB family protein